MIPFELVIHYCAVSLCTVLAAFGVSMGHAKTTQASFNAIYRQPGMKPDITRSTILALALIETAAILGLLLSFFLFFSTPPTLSAALGEIGIALAIGIPALVVGWASGTPTSEAIGAIGRQPFMSRKLMNFSLLALSIIQTPLIFGFIVALLIKVQLGTTTTIGQGLALIGAGIASGFGSIGPVIGGCNFSGQALKGAGNNKEAFTKLFTFTIFSQAIIETPIIFATVIALLLTRTAQLPIVHPLVGVAYLLVGFTIGVGTIGPGISSGKAAASAAEQIGYYPESYGLLSRASLMAQGLIGAIAVYAFIIALWIIVIPLN